MRKALLLAVTAPLLVFAGFQQPVLADSAVSCVQEQLSGLGHDPGPIDGQFGAKTIAAFAGLSGAYPDRVAAVGSELTATNADVWCAGLAEAFPAVAAAYDSYKLAIEDESGGFRYDIAPDVPAASVQEIRDGLRLARAYIAKTFGSEIPDAIRAQMTVKIVATGRGNQEPGGGGGVATAFAVGSKYPRPFFDVAHEQWSQDSRGRGWTTRTDNLKTVAHEYTHGWQSFLGALDIHTQVLGNWMNEGIAEYLAYRALEDAGLVRWEDVRPFVLGGASGVQTNHPLSVFGTTRTPAWAGHVGFVAIDWLVSETPSGIMALKTIAEEVAAGRSQRQAFAAAFGLELDDFYTQFEAWRPVILETPGRALSSRPRLELPPAGTLTIAEAPDPNDASAATLRQAQAWFEAAMALDGKGADSDIEAVRLYRMAAEAGHAEAARNFAGMLGSGRGVAENQVEAARWFRAAAEAGDAQGQYAFATWYLGNSPTDREERVSWLRKAAAQGHQQAIASLNELGVPLIEPKAAEETDVATVAGAADEAVPFPSVRIDPRTVPTNGVQCVQMELNALGFDAGPPDGLMGDRTRSASAAYLEQLGSPWTDRPVSSQTSLKWCLMIADEHPEFNSLWRNLAKPDPIDQTVFADLPSAFEYAVRESDRPLTRSELEEFVLDRPLVFDFGKPATTTLLYRRSGELFSNDELVGTFRFADDGEICVLRTNGEDCRLYLMHHGMLLQTNPMGERWIPELSAAD